MKHGVILVALVFSLDCPMKVLGQGVDWGAKKALSELQSPDGKERYKAAFEILSQREEILRDLLGIAESDPQIDHPIDTPKAQAIDILARYRVDDPEAIDFLVRDIAYRPRTIGVRPFSVTGAYASKNALVRIGLPSVEGVFRRLRDPINKQELQLFAATFREILGEEIGLLRLEQELNEYMGKERRVRLEKLIDIYMEGIMLIEIGGEVY